MKTRTTIKITEIAEALTCTLLGVTLIFTPLFFAATSEPYQSISFLLISLVGIFTSINLLIQKDQARLNFLSNQIKKLRLLISVYILVLIWILIQIFTHISYIPAYSLNKFFDLTCYGILFISTILVTANSKLKESTGYISNTIIKTIAILSSILGLYGLVTYLGKIDKILWLDKTSYIDSLTGTFINRNSFATYLGMGIILNLLLLLKKEKFPKTDSFNKKSLIKTTKAELFFNDFFSKKIIYVIGIIINFTALLLTYSRWGLTTFLFGLIIFIALFLNTKKQTKTKKKSTLPIILIALSIVSAIIILYITTLGLNSDWVHKFSLTNYHINHRLGIYQTTIEAIKNSTLLGHGAGTFEFIFEKFRTNTLPLSFNQRIIYAHNGYLQTIAELGLVGAALLFYCFGYLFYSLFRGLHIRKKEHTYLISGISILTVLAANSLLDFSIQVQTVTITFLVLMGIFYNYIYSTKDIEIAKKSDTTQPKGLYILSLILLLISIISLTHHSKNIAFYTKTKPYNHIINQIRAAKHVDINNLQRFILNREEVSQNLGKNSYHYLQIQNELSIAKFHLLDKNLFWLDRVETNKLINSAIYNTEEELRLNPLNSYSYMRLAELYLKNNSVKNSLKSLQNSLEISKHDPNLMFWRTKFIIDNRGALPQEHNKLLEWEICKIAENNTYDFIEFYKNNYTFSSENLEVNVKVCNILKHRCDLREEYTKILYKICK